MLFDSLGLPVEAGVAAGSHAAVLISLQDNGGAIEIAEPRWRALDGVPGAERALMRLSGALCQAHEYRGEYDLLADFAERQILLAEAVVDPVVLARAHLQLGNRYVFDRGADLGGRPVRDGCRHCPQARLLRRTRACADQPGDPADQP